MTGFIRTEKKNGKRVFKGIAVALVCALLLAALTAFAACGSKTLYTYEQVMSGTYVLTETDDETAGKTLNEIMAELENEYGCDFKKMTDEDGIIYLIRDSGVTQTENQADLGTVLQTATEYARLSSENFVEHINRVVEKCVNNYFKTNHIENKYRFIQLDSKLIKPIFTNDKIVLFYDAENIDTGDIALGYIEVNISQENQIYLNKLLIDASNGDQNAYAKTVEGVMKLLEGCAEVIMTEDIDESLLKNANYSLDWRAKVYGYNENGICFDGTSGRLVYYNKQLYFYRTGEKDGISYETITPVTCNIETYDKDSFAFIFRDANTDEILWIEFIDSKYSEKSLADYSDIFAKASQK